MESKQCESCGNKFEGAFEVLMQGNHHIFDSFECAINTLAPECAHCGNMIIGHGVEAHEHVYCCAHCANSESEKRISEGSNRSQVMH